MKLDEAIEQIRTISNRTDIGTIDKNGNVEWLQFPLILTAMQGAKNEIKKLRDDLNATRLAHSRLARGVKSALGLKNWPTEFEGSFQEMPGRLVAARIATFEEYRKVNVKIKQNLVDELKSLAARVAELEKVAEKPPRTADGVAIVPGMEIVSTHYDAIQSPRVVTEIRNGEWRFMGSSWYSSDDKERQCYSTLAAAQAAKGGR